MKKVLTLTIVTLAAMAVSSYAAAQVDANQINEQLLINKNALLTGTDQQIRIKAASIMLSDADPAARTILVDVLCDADNPASQKALCQALINANGQDRLDGKDVFVEPLLTFLKNQQNENAIRLAADTLLIFDYARLEPSLLAIIADTSLPSRARLNAVFAFRRQPDIRAIVRLIELLDNPDPQVVKSAGQSLDSLAIPAVGADERTRQMIIEEIQRIGREEFLRYWQIRQGYEKRLNELSRLQQSWQKRCLEALDELYIEAGPDEGRKVELLTKSLSRDHAAERLWGLSRLSQWWVGTEPKTRVVSDLGPVLVKMVSDSDPAVRLADARLVGLMPQLDSAKALITQHKVETDDRAKIAQFMALGQACAYAFSPQSAIKLDPALRIETLDLAVLYLNVDDPVKVQKGAEVIRDLLANDGLIPEQLDLYLSAIAKRYNRQNNTVILRAELLNVIAVLCGQNIYRGQTTEKYKPLLEMALNDKNDPLREAAVNGLANIDKSEALRSLRDRFAKDTNPNIRKKLISLAEEVGTTEDIEWLSENINTNSEGALVWKALLRIFDSAETAKLVVWFEKLKAGDLGPTRQIALLKIIERKAQAQNDSATLIDTWQQLAELYIQDKQYPKAAQNLASLLARTADTEKKKQFKAKLLLVHLESGRIDQALNLIEQQLLEQDIPPDGPFGKEIAGYFAETEDSNDLLTKLNHIPLAQDQQRPQWQKLLESLKIPSAPVAEIPVPQPEEPNLTVSEG